LRINNQLAVGTEFGRAPDQQVPLSVAFMAASCSILATKKAVAIARIVKLRQGAAQKMIKLAVIVTEFLR
jgi:hypothetical protein